MANASTLGSTYGRCWPEVPSPGDRGILLPSIGFSLSAVITSGVRLLLIAYSAADWANWKRRNKTFALKTVRKPQPSAQGKVSPMHRSDDEDLAHGDRPERSSTEFGSGLTRRRLLAQSAQATAIAAATATGIVRPAQAAPSPESLFLNPFNKFSAHHRPVGRGIPGRDANNNPDVYYGIPGTTGPATRGRMAIVTTINLQGPVGNKFNHWVSPGPIPIEQSRRHSTHYRAPNRQRRCRLRAGLPEGAVYPPEPDPPQDCNIFFYPRRMGPGRPR